MKKITVSKQEEGQRLDKFLKRILPKAQPSFLYKMLRKKNITLSGKKAAGKEILAAGDTVEIFFSDETYALFSADNGEKNGEAEELIRAYRRIDQQYHPKILYEDADLVLADKPCGLLSQKAEEGSLSLNEWFPGYLLAENRITPASLSYYRPSVANRLDRNTSGIVFLAASLAGSRYASELLRNRDLHKYYAAVVRGKLPEHGVIESSLQKEEGTNTVTQDAGGRRAVTKYICLYYDPKEDLSLAGALLVTGRTHQLRAHFAGIGHPILGDPKYGDPALNAKYAGRGIRHQLLCCCRVEFPKIPEKEPFSGYSRLSVTTDLPGTFAKALSSLSGEKELHRLTERLPEIVKLREKKAEGNSR